MSSNMAPSPDALIESFPATSLPRIEGEPNYDSLALAKDVLKGNAASVPTIRGGGTNGYLGIILSDAAYATVDPIAFVRPANPGIQPQFPAGNVTAAATAVIVRQHNEDLREWREFQNMELALKKQLVNCMDALYLRAIKNRHVGYNNVTIRDMLNFLFTNYGRISPLDLQANSDRMRTAWDPTTPFELLIDQIEECTDLADAGNAAYTATQILNAAYTLVFNTGHFFEDTKGWNQKPVAEKTWANFKTHFFEAHRQLKMQQRTTQQAGYHTANAAMENKFEEATTALANLATATAADRQTMTVLTNTVNTLTNQVKSQDATITELRNKISKHNKENNNNTTGKKGFERKDQGSYCYSHGFLVAPGHTGHTCKSPKEGHKPEATRENTMGGSTFGKPK